MADALASHAAGGPNSRALALPETWDAAAVASHSDLETLSHRRKVVAKPVLGALHHIYGLAEKTNVAPKQTRVCP
jgi:hypothetical protein